MSFETGITLQLSLRVEGSSKEQKPKIPIKILYFVP